MADGHASSTDPFAQDSSAANGQIVRVVNGTRTEGR
jgi:DNA-directed RNA polymerase subunit H (RpoH/RPB5)